MPVDVGALVAVIPEEGNTTRMISTRADQIEPTRPVWTWNGWIVAGCLHLLVARQGMGKSTVLAWLMALVTTFLTGPLLKLSEYLKGERPGAIESRTRDT